MGTSVPRCESSCMLVRAIEAEKFQTVHHLLSNGADSKAQIYDRCKALMFVADNGHIEIQWHLQC